VRSRAPRPGLLGAQGRRRRKAVEEGGEGEVRRKKRKERAGQDGREGSAWKRDERERDTRWEAKERHE